MAAASMTMAMVSARFGAVSTRAESSLSRNGGALSLGVAPLSCSFSELSSSLSLSSSSSSSKRNGASFDIVARAVEVTEYTFVDGEIEETPEIAAPAPVQQGSKLYVGNLPWTCDSAQLAEVCQDVGTVEEVEVIYDQESGRSRGFAFVTMASDEDAQAVIKSLDGSDMGGRALRVNYPQSARDKPRFERGERPERRTGGGGGSRRPFDDPNKLFVGNLTWGCDEGDLHQLFSDFGKVVEAKVVYDRESGRSRGFGFVTLENASEVSTAIENLDGADFEGRQLRVNLAGEKPPPRF